MASTVEEIIQAVEFILEPDALKAFQDDVAAVLFRSSDLDLYEALKVACHHLRDAQKITAEVADRLDLALDVSRLSGNNRTLIKAVDERTNVNSLRDLAVHFDTATIRNIISTEPAAASSPESIRTAIFNAAPTATVQGMVMADKVPLTTPDPQVKADVVDVLSKLDVAAIGSVPAASLPSIAPEAFAAVPEERREAVTHELKMLSRVSSIAPTTSAVQALVNQGLTTSLAIANIPKANFISSVASSMPADVASMAHANAVNNVIRNENMLVGLLQLVRGTGLEVIDGKESAAFRKLKVKKLMTAQSHQLNLENLFGSMNQCVCDDCTTVYSAASYFVDLLQYLKETPLVRDVVVADLSSQGQQPSIAGTVLERLARRRPDLLNLQLSCANTNTILPYIDLANEVMESYIGNLDSLAVSAADVRSKQVKLDAFNVSDEEPQDVLAEPQNTNYSAYQAVAAASYPLTLPYHQPIDAQRAFLDFLKVPRTSLLEAFRQKPPNIDRKLYPSLDDTQMAMLQSRLVSLQDVVLNRQVDAEMLSLVQEEYLILTREVFFPLEFFNVTENISLTLAEYQARVGLLSPAAYWGYSTAEEMLSTDEVSRVGLQFVKKQFLPRSGITYSNLVSLVRTDFLNPRQPKGRDKTVFNTLRFSYKFLLTLVDARATDPRRRLGKLAEFLVRSTNVIHLAELLSDRASGVVDNRMPSKQRVHLVDDDEVRDWVFTKFESFGKVIVLDSGEGPRLPVEGRVVARTLKSDIASDTEIGILATDGSIRDAKGVVVANVDINSRVLVGSAASGVTIEAHHPGAFICVLDPDSRIIAFTRSGLLFPIFSSEPVEWFLTEGLGGGCDITNVRLTHLDGTGLTTDEWSNFHKFIRLWRRLGWSVRDTDMALTGLGRPMSTPPAPGGNGDSHSYTTGGIPTPLSQDNELITLNSFTHDPFSSGPGAAPSSAGAPGPSSPPITPDTITQLAAIKKLITLTGLPVEQLLVCWADIPTSGDDKPLYERLFFRGNIRRTDPTFGPDANGDYFTTSPPCKISDRLLDVLAAFRMKAADIAYLLDTDKGNGVRLQAPIPDLLSISNLSAIYRHGLIANLLGVPVADIGQVLAGGFPSPFTSPVSCLELINIWNSMEKIGFSWPQLRFVADDVPSELDPLAPSTKTVLQAAKTLHDGLVDILKQHKVPGDREEVTPDMVQAKAGLLFDEKVVKMILSLLGGETIYLTHAPSFVRAETFETDLSTASSKKAVYLPGENNQSSQLQVTGILTEEEATNILGLLDPEIQAQSKSGAFAGSVTHMKLDRAKMDAAAAALHDEWSKTVARARRQPRNIFHDSLSGLFPKAVADLEMDTSTATLLAPDVRVESPAGKTPARKRHFFLQNFIPFLQDKLARVLILDTVSTGAGFDDRKVAQTLLENIALEKTSTETAMEFLLEKLTQPDSNESEWSGYLAPVTSDTYIFCVWSSEKPPPFVLDGRLMTWTLQQEDPQNLWSTMLNPVKLDSGKLYRFQLPGLPTSRLQWKPAQGSRASIPPSSFLPDGEEDRLRIVFTSLQKLAIVTNIFKLSSDEVIHIYDHPEDFEGIDFMHMSVSQWNRLKLYVEFRDSLPSNTDMSLLDLYKWAVNNPAASRHDIIERIVAGTSWKTAQVGQILDHLSFPTLVGASTSNFRNGVNLRKFTQLIDISNRLGVDIPRLFSWASPVGTTSPNFFKLHNVAEDIEKVARAKYDRKAWPDAVKPVSDILRENQKNALISYLLVQDEIKTLDITDADGLFEYFLIDTQMTPPVETSRIKQAIATVQVYVQRCLLGLEDAYGVPASALDRQRWNWMQKYRVWEANRKVFLYPENWTDPSLRDDKSEFFAALESELMQKDLSKGNVSAALNAFLHNVSDVANMVVTGLCVSYTDPANPVYIFARTRSAPYTYFHNKYVSGRWASWSKMAIEIPVYTVEQESFSGDVAGHGSPSGVYLAPIACNNRLIVFVPQIMKKTVVPQASDQTFSALAGNAAPSGMQAASGWEIKLSWAEYRNGAWTARKLCPEGVLDMPSTISGTPTAIDRFQVVPTEITETDGPTSETPSMIKVFVASPSGVLGEWHFRDGQLGLAATAWPEGSKPTLTAPTEGHSFGYETDSKMMFSWQAFAKPTVPQSVNVVNFRRAPFSTAADPANGSWGSQVALNLGSPVVSHSLFHPHISGLMSASMASRTGDDAPLFDYLGSLRNAEQLRAVFGSMGLADDNGSMIFDEQSQPFSIYNWELGLHAPMRIIDQLLQNQQFEQALDVCHLVFSPLAAGEKNDLTRFWVFAPFRFVQKQTVQAMFQAFRPGESRDDVTAWRQNPFAPHVIARSRPLAYMKWIVMKYIEILIGWGDAYFRQNTLETIPNAIQMYILASHLYGPRGQKVTREGKVKPQTYNSLLNKFDAFSNALVELEEAFPFSNQTTLPVGKLPDDSEVSLANVFGFAGTLYFSIPDNPNLRALGEKIDDRLFKIRHSLDIQGVFRRLPLFEPPIDPALLVQATAQGLSLNSVLADLNGPMPNYRFVYLLTRALEMTAEVKQMGQSLLAAREKEQSEAYSVLRASHDTGMYGLTVDLKKMALDEATKNLEVLQYSRNSPVNRLKYYLQLAGESLGAIPGGDAASEFQELSERLMAPVDQGGLKMLPYEKEEMDLSSAANTITQVTSGLEALAGIFNALPTVGAHGTPLGCGAVFNYGPPYVGAATSAISRGLSMGATELQFRSGMASRKAQALRALNDRLQAANAAGYEISNIDKQIIASKIRVAMAAKDVDVQQRQIDQAREAEDFLRTKYTNAELYSWIAGQTKAMYYNTYTAAYELAMKAQKAFSFERPRADGKATSFIQPGYWNASRDGLLAGEQLWCALKRLEAAYISDKGHDYEVVKNVSLRQIDPMQLLTLRETGSCTFAVPEVLYDMDFPGHYIRRIRSVTVTIPCVVGPYTSVNATLRLLSSRCRVETSLMKDGYREVVDPGTSDSRFVASNSPIKAIAVSSAQADGGLFELSFSGDRYLPFEGAGAISEWQLDLPPPALRTFEYTSISDVILTIRYTSVEGGTELSKKAVESVQDYASQVSDASDAGGLCALFDVKNEFASGWSRLVGGNSDGKLEMKDLRDRLPLFAVGRSPGTVVASEIHLLVDGALPNGEIGVSSTGAGVKKTETTLTKKEGDMKGFTGYSSPADANVPVETWTLQFPQGGVGSVKRVWLFVRYILKR